MRAALVALAVVVCAPVLVALYAAVAWMCRPPQDVTTGWYDA
jgi:hypothetical protein